MNSRLKLDYIIAALSVSKIRRTGSAELSRSGWVAQHEATTSKTREGSFMGAISVDRICQAFGFSYVW